MEEELAMLREKQLHTVGEIMITKEFERDPIVLRVREKILTSTHELPKKIVDYYQKRATGT